MGVKTKVVGIFTAILIASDHFDIIEAKRSLGK